MFETGRISVIRGSRLMLFQLRGHGHPHDNATHNFFPDSKSFLLGLSNEEAFVSGLFREGG